VLSGEPVDFVAAYAHPLPLHTIATLLGLPRAEWDAFGRLAAAASSSNPHLETRAALRSRLVAELELLRYFRERVGSPGDGSGLLTTLHGAVADGGATVREAVGLCREVLVAGADSTVNHLSSALLLLAQEPALRRRVTADPEALDAFIEEALRLEPPFAGFWRRARHATTLGGVELREGALLLIPFAALNRDPAAFACPDAVDVDRSRPHRHLAFGQGIHFCVGAPLARLESRATFRALLPRVGAIELLCDPAELRPRPSIQDRGVAELPVRLPPLSEGRQERTVAR
jgi:cytochrome P450